MRNVLNTAQYGINVLIEGEYIHFDAREIKPLPFHLVNSKDFAKHESLLDIGGHVEEVSKSEINTPFIPAEPEVAVIDNKLVEVETVEDKEIVREEKPKRQRKVRN